MNSRLEKLRERVRQLLYRYDLHELDDDGFRGEVAAILKDYGQRKPIFQNFGLVVEERQRSRPKVETDHIWEMLSEVDSKIGEDLKHWKEAMAI